MKTCRTITLACVTLLGVSSARPQTTEHRGVPSRPAPKSIFSPEPQRAPDSSIRHADRSPSANGADRATQTGGIEQPERGGIDDFQKASSVLGMEVRDEQNEKVGDIKDLVFDLVSGRIGYLVLSSGGFLGFGDRLIAVPPSALHAATDGRYLVVPNREKILNAPAFSNAHWPDPRFALIDDYWADRGAVGSAGAGVVTGSSSAQSDALRRPGAAPSGLTGNIAGRPARRVFKGKITAIDPEMRTITVEGVEGSRSLSFTTRPRLTIKSHRNPTLGDFKVGYLVTVGYHEDANGNLIAHSLSRIDATEVK